MSDGIESRLKEERRFAPSDTFVAHSRVRSHAEYVSMYQASLEDPEKFWRDETRDMRRAQ